MSEGREKRLPARTLCSVFGKTNGPNPNGEANRYGPPSIPRMVIRIYATEDQASACFTLISGFQFRWIQTLCTSPNRNMQITTNVPE